MDQQQTQSPLAQLFGRIIARDEADRAIEFARLSAIAERRDDVQLAYWHAMNCLDACAGWELETLSHNIESNYPDLTLDECDDIARRALAIVAGTEAAP